MNHLHADPDAKSNGMDHHRRQVFSGHYVPVTPTPIANPEYITHSQIFFKELGLSDELALDPDFQKVFSGDLSQVTEPMKNFGWATGYALSIYGNEYTAQCPFGTGNGYGDGRAISVFEGEFNNQRWEMQLKGAGPTPYCRGADGRAVLRSSVREFLAQEYMHALHIPTSRSLSLFVSKSETVLRPWYSQNSKSADPDIMVSNPVAISTRVAPSFLRVGQIELFARRTRNDFSPERINELKMIVEHLIAREYKAEIEFGLTFEQQIIKLAKLFRTRLINLICHWLRVGYCQGNFNSDNCAAGGFTLDFGPFGFCEAFDSEFQPWTGGGHHFSFFNQPNAAQANFHSFIGALRPLLLKSEEQLKQLEDVANGFANEMKTEIEKMWSAKLGLKSFDASLVSSMLALMMETQVDYTIFFRELSHKPDSIEPLKKSFYQETNDEIESKWNEWLNQWHQLVITSPHQLKQINPKYAWREWLIVPAYQAATKGDYSLIKELQDVLSDPYGEQSTEIEKKYYRLRPLTYFNVGGVSHYSCSS